MGISISRAAADELFPVPDKFVALCTNKVSVYINAFASCDDNLSPLSALTSSNFHFFPDPVSSASISVAESIFNFNAVTALEIGNNVFTGELFTATIAIVVSLLVSLSTQTPLLVLIPNAASCSFDKQKFK